LHRLLSASIINSPIGAVAFSAVNYRRFFRISGPCRARVEDPKTFPAFILVARLDFERTIARPAARSHRRPAAIPASTRAVCGNSSQAAPRRPGLRGPFYVIIEKILGEASLCRAFPGCARHHRLLKAQRHLAGFG